MARVGPNKKKAAAPSEVGRLNERVRKLTQQLSETVPKDELERKLQEFGIWKSRSRQLNRSKMKKLQATLEDSDTRVRDLKSEVGELELRLEGSVPKEELDKPRKRIADLEKELAQARDDLDSSRDTISKLKSNVAQLEQGLEGSVPKEESEEEIHELESKLAGLQVRLAEGPVSQEELDKSNRRIGELESELYNVREALVRATSGEKVDQG